MEIFLQNDWSKGDLSVHKVGLFFQTSQYLLTLFPAEAVALWKRHDIVEKQNTRLSSETKRTSCLTNCRTI